MDSWRAINDVVCCFNLDADLVDMNDEYWRDPSCAAYVLKSFLLELPDPLIPLECYEELITLTGLFNNIADQ